MKIEDLLIFAMSEDSNDYLQEPIKCVSHESDEGCCILAESLQPIRRASSTPNLLQIPPHVSRSRKKSDDSAVGSGEESEIPEKPYNNHASDMLFTTTNNTSTQSSIREQQPTKIPAIEARVECHRKAPDIEVPGGVGVGVSVEPGINCVPSNYGQLLRPPSVVVSDHDLCPDGGETFLTLDDLDAEFISNRRRLSDCSTCSTLSLNEPDYYATSLPEEEPPDEVVKKVSAWGKIRTIVHQLTPFIQTYKKQRYPWVQLAGHQGNFKAGEKPGTILKKFCAREKEAFEILMNDSLRPFVPKYYGSDAEDDYIELEDLLGRFGNPCVMDCKIGVRTYLEEELLKAKEKPKLRKDMYEKMLQIDRTAPTSEEHQMRGVTKPRYMVWRETISTTASFGFRIEGVRKSDGTSSKDFKTTKSEPEVKVAFKSFIDGYEHIVKQYLERLHELRHALEQSKFFSSHEVIGSSLLFVHDSKQASVWMIDFAKTIPLPNGVPPLRHDVPWSVGNHEDGYLIGLTHLIKIFEELIQ
ncbi:unnamed protein product [Allacma fusca]|uniref:Kinase n=1 Tax=Allacma fusca TaxID=39272 RepID=A0A8J2LIS5_9HEXA|nr:unnamed protein product [Allacma fusca]